MATIQPTTRTVTDPQGFRTVTIVTWANMANGDDGAPFADPGSADRNIQVGGTFGTGGTLLWEGSNQGNPPATFPGASDWATLSDPGGVALSLSAAGIKEVSEVPLWMRPRVSAGDGTTAITVTMVVRRTR